MDASDLATCIIPLGAKLDEDEQDPALEATKPRICGDGDLAVLLITARGMTDR